MKQAGGNICKFVTRQSGEQLTTINFVLEKDAAINGIRQLRSCDIMYLTVSGSGHLVTDTRSFELTPGTLFFTFTGVPYTIRNDDDMVYMYISFRGRRAAELYSQFGISHTMCVFPGYSGLVSFWKNAIGRAAEQNLDLISESVLLYSFSQMTRPDGQNRENLAEKMIHIIETEFTDSGFTLDACAEKLGYNAKYASRIFRQSVGVTFSEYLRNERIRHAVFLIEQGVCVVKNVALLSGYSDPLYFSNVFRQTVGVPPSEYIAEQGGHNDQGAS